MKTATVLKKHRKLPQSTRLAKAVYWLAGQLSRIRTPSHLYELRGSPNELGEYEDMDDMFIRRPGWVWSSWSGALKLIFVANRLDWVHFDHWALDHSRCEPTPCEKCGGFECGLEDDI